KRACRQLLRDVAGLDSLAAGGGDAAATSTGAGRQCAKHCGRLRVRRFPPGERRRQRAAGAGSARGAVPGISAVATAAAAYQPPAIERISLVLRDFSRITTGLPRT